MDIIKNRVKRKKQVSFYSYVGGLLFMVFLGACAIVYLYTMQLINLIK